MEESIIILKNVTKTYLLGKTQVQALRGINLEVKKGEFMVILGPSGCGKTTLLSIIGGIERPTSGQVYINNIDITRLQDHELTEFRRRSIGFVFQFFNLMPTLTAKENVMLALELRGVYGEKAELEALKILEEVGLGDRVNHFPSELSGGQQQRVAVARALAKNAPILICDEPTGELDVASGKMVLSQLIKANKDYGKTILLATHNTAIGGLAHRIVRLRDGKVAEIIENKSQISLKELTW